MTTADTLVIAEVDAADDDRLGRWLAVRNAVDPRPVTPTGFRAELTAATVVLMLLASRDDTDVGAAIAGWGAIAEESGNAYLDVWVLPDARRAGIGSRLAERLVAFALRHGMRNGRGSAVEGDAAAIRFAARFGLEPVGAGQVGRLDLTAVHATPLDAPPDVEITSFAEHPELDRAVYELNSLVQPEIPSLAIEPRPSFDAWRRQVTGDPMFLADLSLLALRHGRLIGVIQLYDNGERTAFIGMTAVHPDARRQGIARALKAEVAARAARSGWQRIETFNDGTNDAMRTLNLDLGYAYLPRLVTLKGSLASAAGDGAT
jgi:GNAT superfamily N-acetyltransferase